MADTDYQAMLRKFLQFYPTGGIDTANAAISPNDGLGQQNFNQRFVGAPMGQGIGADFPRGGGVGMPQNIPLPQARPSMGLTQPQFDQRFSGIGAGMPQNIPIPQARPNIPTLNTQPPMPQGGGLAGMAPGQPLPISPGGPGFFQRNAMMQTDPNTGQPIDPQAAALAQALMNSQTAA